MKRPVYLAVTLLLGWAAMGARGAELKVAFSGNTTLLEGNEFSRLCTVESLEPNEDLTLQWIHDGDVVAEVNTNSDTTLRLLIAYVSSSDAGEYFCRAVDSQGSVVLGPFTGGIVTILDNSLVIASDQYAVVGDDIELECSISIQGYVVIPQLANSNGQYISTTVSNISLGDAGTYTCTVQLSQNGVSLKLTKGFTLYVIVPTVITSKPEPYQKIDTNREHQITIHFTGRVEQNTSVTWARNSLLIPDANIETIFTGEAEGESTLSFNPVLRADNGVYRVVVQTTLGAGILSSGLLIDEANFQIDVVVKPKEPDNVETKDVTATSALVEWTYLDPTPDQEPDGQVIKVFVLPENVLFQEHQLPGNQRQLELEGLLPGMVYQVSVVAVNQDGEATTNSTSFITDSRPPKIDDGSVAAIRTDLVTFALNMTLLYTGGGAITEFKIEFRESGSAAAWQLVESPSPSSVPSFSSDLTWSGVAVTIAKEYSSKGQLDFQITVINSHELVSSSEVEETLIPPGAPTELTSQSLSLTTLVITVTLSIVGTPPITEVTLEHSDTSLGPYTLTGLFLPGSKVVFTVNNLSSEIQYSFRASATSYAGQSAMSQEATLQTSDPSALEEDEAGLSMLLVVVIVVCATGVIIAIVIAVVIGMCLFCRHRHKKHGYPITPKNEQSTGTRLSGSHEMIDRTENHKIRAQLQQGPFTKPNDYIMQPEHANKTTNPITGQQTTPPSSLEDSPTNINGRLESNSVTILGASAAALRSESLTAVESAPTLHYQGRNVQMGYPHNVAGRTYAVSNSVPHLPRHGRQGSLPVSMAPNLQLLHPPRHISRSHAMIGNNHPLPAPRGRMSGSAAVLPTRRYSYKHERVPSNSTCSTTSDYPIHRESMASTTAFIPEFDRSASAMAGELSVHPAMMGMQNPAYYSHSQEAYQSGRRVSGMTIDSESDVPVPSDTSLQCVPSGHSQSSSSTPVINNHLPKMTPPQKFKMPIGSSCSSTSSQEMIQPKRLGSQQFMISALPPHSRESLPTLHPGVYSVHSTQESVPRHPSFMQQSQLASDV